MISENASDTIGMFSQAKYVYDNEADVSERLGLVIDGDYSGFYSEDKSVETNFEIDCFMFDEVLKYEYSFTDSNNVKVVYIAKEIGIIQLEKVNGEVWVNENLDKKLNIDFDSFTYSENTCE